MKARYPGNNWLSVTIHQVPGVTSMAILPIYVGLDYHSGSVQVCVLDSAGKVRANRKVGNSASEIHRVVSQVGSPDSVALEACCGAANLADELGQRFGWHVQLAHPGYVARMKRGPDKTDFSDAWLLADLLRVRYLPVVWLAPEQIRGLRRLVRFRDQLVKERRNAKLRIRGLLREHRRVAPAGINAWTKAWLRWLEQEPFSEDDRWLLEQQLEKVRLATQKIRETEGRLRAATQQDVVVQKLMKMAGVGLVTAVTLRAEVGQFDRFASGKQLARFCCVSPRNASSGDRQADAGLVKAGSPLLRSIIIETAHRLVWRIDSRWHQMATSLINRGKPKNVAVAAVANRWVRWLHHEITLEGLAA